MSTRCRGADWSRLPDHALYPGLFDYLPNEDAAHPADPGGAAGGARSWPLGAPCSRRPEPDAVASRGSPARPGVEVTGAVESVVPYLEQPCVVTLPIAIASGTRLKILEAFAVGRPVVSSAKGAEGIEARRWEHLLIRETPESIADGCIDLWNRPAAARDSLQNALELVRARYSWSIAARRIAQSLDRSLAVAPFKPMHGKPRLRSSGL